MTFCTDSYHWANKWCGMTYDYRIKPETTKKETKMTTPHKHAVAIKAWADGKLVQIKGYKSKQWADVPYPSWSDEYEYRVKPEPAKDFTKYVGVGIENSDPAVRLTAAYNKPHKLTKIEGPNGGVYHINNTLKLTINGETRKVTSVEIL